MGYDLGAVLVFALAANGLALAGLTAGRLLRPHRPERDKGIVYECGERPIGAAWFNFNPRFYLVALVFVIFEVDVALTLPVVAVFKEWMARGFWTGGLLAVEELLVFTLILVVGLVWVWIRGDLAWVKRLVRDTRTRGALEPGHRREGPDRHGALARPP